MAKTKELIVMEDLNPEEVFTENGVPALIKKVESLYVPKLDATTEEGREERRSMAYDIAKLKNSVDGMGKDHVGKLKKITASIDERRRKWRNDVQQLQDDIRKPLTEYELAESQRIGGHNTALNEMRDLMSYDYEPDSSDIEQRIAKVSEIFERDFEEFADQAKTVYENTSGRLGEKLAHQIAVEEQAKKLAEAERIIKENEEKEAKEAIQKEAEEAAKKKVQDDLDAANARAEEAERKVEEVTTKSPGTLFDTPRQESAPLASEKEHKRNINNSIVNTLVDECMISESAAKEVVKAIVSGNIPNTKITY